MPDKKGYDPSNLPGPRSARWMRRLSTSTEEKARSAAHVKVLETAEELQQRQAAFPSQKCRGTHERVWRAAGFVLVERQRGELGIGLLQLEVRWE
jgi:inosine/xanthosine triphosphate pyrophosphatase family protein